MDKYVAFLRGINLGKRSVKMDELRAAFAKLGFKNAQTLIASGNVLFEASSVPDVAVIQGGLANSFGFEIAVVLRSLSQLQTMIAQTPFADYAERTDVKKYVTMAAGPLGQRLVGMASQPDDFDLVRVDDEDFFTVGLPQGDGRYGPGLDAVERKFRDLSITTRNWNTVLRIVKKASDQKQQKVGKG